MISITHLTHNMCLVQKVTIYPQPIADTLVPVPEEKEEEEEREEEEQDEEPDEEKENIESEYDSDDVITII